LSCAFAVVAGDTPKAPSVSRTAPNNKRKLMNTRGSKKAECLGDFFFMDLPLGISQIQSQPRSAAAGRFFGRSCSSKDPDVVTPGDSTSKSNASWFRFCRRKVFADVLPGKKGGSLCAGKPVTSPRLSSQP
jgi:hypothetical protein